MKRVRLLFVISMLTTAAFAQNTDCSCKEDLVFLDQKIRKIPAYKTNKSAYEKAYSTVLQELNTETSTYQCYVLINTLLLSINDNHSRAYSLDPGASTEIKEDAEQYAAFKKSMLYNAYPGTTMDLDSLSAVLGAKPKDDREGIYRRKDYLSIGVYENKKEGNYQAVVLDSETDLWRKGEIIYTFLPFGQDYFLGLGGSLSSKRLIAYTERIEAGVFHFMGFKKDAVPGNYALETLSDETYYREEIAEDITYVKIGSFNSWYPALSDAEKFYDGLDGSLTKPKLIVDLRNNGGGGDRNSDILYKILKAYAKNNQVYVLINHRTVSNAEQFALRLSKLKNAQLLGTRTNGTLAFEVKGGTYTLPCEHFIVTLASKKLSKYLPYESAGVQPDVVLRMDEDWLEQLKSYLER